MTELHGQGGAVRRVRRALGSVLGRAGASGTTARRRVRLVVGTAVVLLGLVVAVAGPSDLRRGGGAGTEGPVALSEQPGTTAAPPRRFTLAASGDVLPHSPVVNRAAAHGRERGAAYDFAPLLARIEPVVAGADLGVCHLETPLGRPGDPPSGYPVFQAPPELAAALHETGYDVCSTASNHSLDQGPDGVVSTIDALDTAGVQHTGTARGPDEDRPLLVDVQGVRVGLVSATYGLNGLTVPDDQPWLVNLLDPEAIAADAAAARTSGAEFTAVLLHWGQEYEVEPTADQRELAARLTADPNVDLVLGHHAHVVQPIEQVGGKWVVFGLGNSLSAQSAACCDPATQDGVVVTVDVVEDGDGFRVDRVAYTPTYVDRPGYRVLDVPAALAAGDSGTAAATLEASLERTRTAVGPAAELATSP